MYHSQSDCRTETDLLLPCPESIRSLVTQRLINEAVLFDSLSEYGMSLKALAYCPDIEYISAASPETYTELATENVL